MKKTQHFHWYAQGLAENVSAIKKGGNERTVTRKWQVTQALVCDRFMGMSAAAVIVMVGEDTEGGWAVGGGFTNGSAISTQGGVMLPLTTQEYTTKISKGILVSKTTIDMILFVLSSP